jgi:hypothetical protein
MKLYVSGLVTGFLAGWTAGWIDAYFLEPKREAKRNWDREMRYLGVR